MAMKPFCGYNFGDYWGHWLSLEGKAKQVPRVFHVNWFRQDKNGKFMWPGYGENLRVLRWIIDRCEGKASAVETPIGFLPRSNDIDTQGLPLDAQTLDTLVSIDAGVWRREIESIGKYLDEFHDRVPEALRAEQRNVAQKLA
jgi:phosphoenolpyruvate carboxykinase (GTP)